MSRGKRIYVGYARTSGLEEKNGRQLDDQVQQIKTFAQRQDIALEQIYYDTGIAGQPRSFRAGIFTLLDHLDLHGTTDVVVVSADRIIREGEIGRQILKELERGRVNILSLTEDPNKVKQDTRRITSTTVAALKSATTKIEALKRGKAPAGRAAYGYRRLPVPGENTTRLTIVDEEAKTVQWIFREYLRRRSMAKVAEGLAARGVAAPGGKEWSRASVAWILGNEIYIGLVKFGSVRGPGEHQPIIEPLLFQKVQELRTTNRRTRKVAKRDLHAGSPDTTRLISGAGLGGPGGAGGNGAGGDSHGNGTSNGNGDGSEAAALPVLDAAAADRSRLTPLDREALEAAERGETIEAPHDQPGNPLPSSGDDFEFEPLTDGHAEAEP